MPTQHISTKRRNGRLQACEPCRTSKHRCDHSTPVCNRCIARGKSDSCIYHPAPMTKTRESNPTTHANLARIYPRVRAVKRIETSSPVPTSSPTPPSYRSPGTRLFRNPGQEDSGITTRFSAVFRENQAQIGADLLDIQGEESSITRQDDDEAANFNLAINTLRDFPTFRVYERLLIPYETMHDPWLSPKMVKHCLNLVWVNFGDVLRGSRSDRSLSSMAHQLFENGIGQPCADKDQPWVNWFCGTNLRWEMIGILFTFFGFTMMNLQDFDELFNLPETRGRSRRLAAKKMKVCADACLSMRNSDQPINDMVVILLKNIGKLHSQIVGDESDGVERSTCFFTSAFIEAGLHRLPEGGPIEPFSEFRRTLSAIAYYLEKSTALFSGRPPALSRFYCTYKIPLDLTEDELFGSAEELAHAVSLLDENGWNTSGRITVVKWFRALCMLTPIREEILEISLGVNMHSPPDKPDQLLRDLSEVTSSYPASLQYCNIAQWSQPSFSMDTKRNFYIVSRLQAEVLQTKFLLERLKQSSSQRRSQDLFDVAQELMSVTLSLWIDRDRLFVFQSALHWMAVDYGIPAAGVLCVELLHNVRNPPSAINMSRSDTIQTLVLYTVFLGWVREGDGNYKLCRKLRKVIQNIIDYVLAAPAVANAAKCGIEAQDFEEISGLEEEWAETADPNWLSLLNTIDWTQGFGVESDYYS